MTARIIDGRARFGMSLEDFYRQEDVVMRAARRGILIPPTAEVDAEAEAALAYINPLPDGSVRWIAECPACREYGRTAAEYVWLDAPLFFCMRCANVALGGRWRPVLVPAERAEIERLLLLRNDPEQRGWTPDETLDELRVQNRRLRRRD